MPRPIDTIWQEPTEQPIPEELASFTSHSPLLAPLLVSRGITTVDQARAFMDPTAYIPAPASVIPDMDRAVNRIQQAVNKGEKIGVWGDFDVDGQTATAILVDGFRSLGAQVSYHIPIRAQESHGVNLSNLEKMLDDGAQLVVTCDTGITAFDAAAFCRERGVDLIVTDHHTPEETLPDALAVVTTQRLFEEHPLRPLCGSATAWQLVRALGLDANRWIDLAALGMVADVAQLTGDGRWITQLGLKQLMEHPRTGIQAILDAAEASLASSTDLIGFTLAPRMNALGRLGDANPAVELLLTDDKAYADQMAGELEVLNRKRKSLCDDVYSAASHLLRENRNLLENDVLVLAHPLWPASVIGIVASRLANLYHRPVVLLTITPDGIARGSARSIDGVNIISAIRECQTHLRTFGGHPGAAGLSLRQEALPMFTQALQHAVAQQVALNPLSIRVPIDAYVPFKDINLDWLEQLEPLAPFGPGNPAMTFAARDLIVRDSRPVGREKEHLLLHVEDGDGQVQKVMWWQADMDAIPQGRFDLAFSTSLNDYRGQKSVQLTWVVARERVGQTDIVTITSSHIQHVDMRTVSMMTEDTNKVAVEPGALVWQEGSSSRYAISGYQRDSLVPSPTLVIWSIPPGYAEIKATLEIVKPDTVYWYAFPTTSDDLKGFLELTGRICKGMLATTPSQSTWQHLAGRAGHRIKTLQLGVAWWAARGAFAIQSDDGETIQLSANGTATPALLPNIETQLKRILQETAAFRAFYRRVDLQQFG
jgi:single-stranded-DNA-specific exonuclease